MNASHTAQEHFRLGQEALSGALFDEALAHFSSAHRLDGASARHRSYHGLALGLAKKQLDRALELCRSAAKEEFFNPEHYHNLARLHIAFGFKAEGIRYLRRGLMIDPGSEPIAEELRRMGVRRRPPLGFLRRQHLFNRWLGRVLGRVGTATEPTPAPFGAGAGASA
jgi:tetratricopeptide (TPR) repeat protein